VPSTSSIDEAGVNGLGERALILTSLDGKDPHGSQQADFVFGFFELFDETLVTGRS